MLLSVQGDKRFGGFVLDHVHVFFYQYGRLYFLMCVEGKLFQFKRTGLHSVSGVSTCLPGPSSGFSLLLHCTRFGLVFRELSPSGIQDLWNWSFQAWEL